MRLCTTLKQENIFLNISPGDKGAAIKHMIRNMQIEQSLASVDVLENMLLEREQEIPTGIGHGIGIPHVNHAPVSDIVLGVATLDPPLEYQSIDNEPVEIIFLVLTGVGMSGSHLKILARISRMSHKGDVLQRLKKAQTPAQFLEILSQFESKYQEL